MVDERLRVEVPEPVTLVGLSVAVSPAGVTEAVRLTVPLKPASAVTVIVEEPVPTVVEIVTVVGDAVTVKSCSVKVTVAEAGVVLPLVPVTVTL